MLDRPLVVLCSQSSEALCRLLPPCVIKDVLAHLNLLRRSWRRLVRFVAMKRDVAVAEVIAEQQGASPAGEFDSPNRPGSRQRTHAVQRHIVSGMGFFARGTGGRFSLGAQ